MAQGSADEPIRSFDTTESKTESTPTALQAEFLSTPATAVDQQQQQRDNDRIMLENGFPGADDIISDLAQREVPLEQQKGGGGGPRTNEANPSDAGSGRAGGTDRKGSEAEIPGGKQQAPMDEKARNVLIDGAIKNLNNPDYSKRTEAQKTLENIGAPALEKLDSARQDPKNSLEVRIRAKSAERAILRADNTSPATAVNDQRMDALQEIANDGKISESTKSAYEKLIQKQDLMRDLDVKQLSESDFESKTTALLKQANDDKAPIPERLAAMRKGDKLFAQHDIHPADQAKLDYADALLKSGDQQAAAKVLEAAMLKNPGLIDAPSMNVRAMEAGLTKEEKTDDLWNSNERKFVNNQIEHFEHETRRFGYNEHIQKDYDSLTKSLDKRLQSHPTKEMKAFVEAHQTMTQKSYATALTADGHHEKANQYLDQMLKNNSSFKKSTWFDYMKELNRR